MSSSARQKQGLCRADRREAELVRVLLEQKAAYVPSKIEADKHLDEYKSPIASRGGKPSHIEERAQILWAARNSTVIEFLERNCGVDERTQISAIRCALRRLYKAVSDEEPAVEVKGPISAEAILAGLLNHDEELMATT